MHPEPVQTGTSTPSAAASTPRVLDVRCEHLRQTLGIGTATPRLSWTTVSATPGWRQAAYAIEIARNGQTLTTGRVNAADSVLVAWPQDMLPQSGP